MYGLLHIGRLLNVDISAVVITDTNRTVISVSFDYLFKQQLQVIHTITSDPLFTRQIGVYYKPILVNPLHQFCFLCMHVSGLS
jgi:hypothetical protein